MTLENYKNQMKWIHSSTLLLMIDPKTVRNVVLIQSCYSFTCGDYVFSVDESFVSHGYLEPMTSSNFPNLIQGFL